MLRRALRLRGYATVTRPLLSEAGSSSNESWRLENPNSSTSTPEPTQPQDSTPQAGQAEGWDFAGVIPDSVMNPKQTSKQESIDKLWDRVLQTPAAVLNTPPPAMDMDVDLPAAITDRTMPRRVKGTTIRRHRAAGQTPHEARSLNDALQRTFDQLEATAFRPTAAGARGFDALLLTPASWKRGIRVEDNEPELVIAVDALAEELSLLTTSTEVVAWAQDKVFTKDDSDNARSIYPRTYPRALAAVIRTLWVRLNAPHLALAMFEHAKILGVESYLAGCQTSAYNELIRVKWEAFRDLAGVLEDVKEMDQHAVAWDRGTSELVGSIVDTVGKEVLEATGRWGREAYEHLAALEGLVQKDTEREAIMFDRRAQNKRAAIRDMYGDKWGNRRVSERSRRYEERGPYEGRRSYGDRASYENMRDGRRNDEAY